MPMTKVEPVTNQPIPNTTYTVLPGVVTRGREPPEGQRPAGSPSGAKPEEDSLTSMLREAGCSAAGAAAAARSMGGAGAFQSSLDALRSAGVTM